MNKRCFGVFGVNFKHVELCSVDTINYLWMVVFYLLILLNRSVFKLFHVDMNLKYLWFLLKYDQKESECGYHSGCVDYPESVRLKYPVGCT